MFLGTLSIYLIYHRNIIGRYLAWNWIRDSWDEISTYWDTAISSSVGR